MKFNTFLAATCVCVASILVSVSTQAAVTLLVDDNIKVTAVNGQQVKQGLFQPLTKEFTLEPGRHVITAKYDRLYELSGDNHDYLRSANISVAAQLEDNQIYHLTMPGQPEAYIQAKNYAKKPVLAIEHNHQIIAQQESINKQSSGLFSGVTQAIGGIFGGSDAQAANQQAIAALEQPNSQSSIQAAQKNEANNGNASTLDRFMQLWLQSTPSEREKIRQWVQE